MAKFVDGSLHPEHPTPTQSDSLQYKKTPERTRAETDSSVQKSLGLWNPESPIPLS